MGLFSPTTWRRKIPLLPDCGTCQLERQCKPHSRKVPVMGGGRLGVLVIGEHPGDGPPNEWVHRTLSRVGLTSEDYWLTWSTICAPPDGPPTDEHIQCCRPSLQRVIEELKPQVIVPMGTHAIKSLLTPIWKDSQGHGASRFAGFQIPCREPNAWVCPTYHPGSGQFDKTADVRRMFIERHLNAALSLPGVPWPKGVGDLTRSVDCVYTDDDAAAAVTQLILSVPDSEPVGVDLETNMLKPDSAEAEIVCCAVANKERAVAFPWLPRVREVLETAMGEGRIFSAFNMKFEKRWFSKFLGHGPLEWGDDQMLRSHWADCREGICSLAFQAFVRLGEPEYYDHVSPYLESEERGGNNKNRIRQVPLRDLLLYCGMDTLIERRLS